MPLWASASATRSTFVECGARTSWAIDATLPPAGGGDKRRLVILPISATWERRSRARDGSVAGHRRGDREGAGRGWLAGRGELPLGRRGRRRGRALDRGGRRPGDRARRGRVRPGGGRWALH